MEETVSLTLSKGKKKKHKKRVLSGLFNQYKKQNVKTKHHNVSEGLCGRLFLGWMQ